MKNSFLILGICALLSISCSSDSFEPLSDDFFLQQLAGTWHATEVVTTGCLEEKENGAITCDSDSCIILTIAPDGLYILIDNLEDPPISETGAASVNEELLIFCSTTDADCENLNYILSDETLTISYQDVETECNLVVVLTRQ